jgi:hypothetical protein
MYTKLLADALDVRQQNEGEPTIGAALFELWRCRDRLSRDASSTVEAGWNSDAIVDQLAYDVALVELARRMDAQCDVQAFNQHAQARARLEDRLDVGGVILAESRGRTRR